ncbi:MAG: hypothetical protein H6R00_1435 [Proteobacteria bacterium]|nr:hypothetical protein [Pseudomonadota bacterium]
MSLAGQISDTVNALAAAREARRQALSQIRAGAARQLKEARAAQRRMAVAQQQHLAEAVRSTKLTTAILIGAADDQIDGYRKVRIQRAARLDKDLRNGMKALHSGTHKWMSTQSAVQRKQAIEARRVRRHARVTLHNDVEALMAQNLAFLSTLTKDRQDASAIWLGRAAHVRPAHGKAAVAKADTVVKAESTLKAEPARAVVVATAASGEVVTSEPAKAEAPRVGQGAKPEMKASEGKASGQTASGRIEPGKSV